jgi:tetratricopeptide (TPR) repeat protein
MRLVLFLAALASVPAGADQAVSPSPTPTPSPSATPTPLAAVSPSPDPTPEVQALLAQADDHYSRRAIGAIDDVARPEEADAAIELYRKALALAPRDIEVLAKLMRAMQFRGAYTGLGIEEKKTLFDEGRNLGQNAIDRLEADAKAARGFSRIEALRLVKGAPALYLWTAFHWGEWGLARGKFASARSGVASRLRDLAQTVVDMDPLFEDGAGYRILGRLHSQAPKIPFFTGWISHEKGVQYLRRAYQIAPNHPVNCFFLGDAILEQEPERKDEALRILESCAALTPRPEWILEDSHYIHHARDRLDEGRGTSPTPGAR